ncbi:MAG: MerR family copper efflux transcriptional regulator [Mariniblastus sp.]|jgi:MerR family copper efflux transcriptional regulator
MIGFTIGKVAKAAGVGVETIRFYEKKGLIEQPQSESTYRSYPKSVVSRIKFVKRAQELEFTLAEIRELLGLADQPNENRAAVKAIAQRKVSSILEKIAGLKKAEETLSNLVERYSGDGPIHDCPIIDAFIDKGFRSEK